MFDWFSLDEEITILILVLAKLVILTLNRISGEYHTRFPSEFYLSCSLN